MVRRSVVIALSFVHDIRPNVSLLVLIDVVRSVGFSCVPVHGVRFFCPVSVMKS